MMYNTIQSRITIPRALITVMVVITVAFAVWLGCGSSTDSHDDSEGFIISRSECGGYDAATRKLAASEDETCIDFQYDDEGTLTFTHYNAGFNCCTDLTAHVTIEGNILTVRVTESGLWCHCLCLFDVDYRIEDIPAGAYVVNIIEPYLPEGDDVISFVAELDAETSGQHCFDRSAYPWEVSASPTGSLTDYSDCKLADTLPDFTAGETCLEWDYDSGTLSLIHTNTTLNCCPVIAADVAVDGSEIVITEIDSLDNFGCDCLCLFDLEYEIADLPVGEYSIKVIEPYLQPGYDTLQGTINLYFDSSGVFCADRGQ